MPPNPKTSEIVADYPSATIEELVANHSKDVSEGGMLLRASSSIPTGRLVDFTVRLATAQVALTGAGRIVWKRDVPEGERPSGVGVKFVDLDELSRTLVDRLVAARKETISEYDRPPSAPGAAKTVLGLAAPPAAARVGTRLGLAPAVVPASLVLDEQSSPTVKPPPPSKPDATSEIDEGWGDEPAPAVDPSKLETRQLELETLRALLEDQAAGAMPDSPEESPPAPANLEPRRDANAVATAAVPHVSRSPERRHASRAAATPARPPRRRIWLWVALLPAAAAIGLYGLRGPLRDAWVSSAPSATATEPTLPVSTDREPPTSTAVVAAATGIAAVSKTRSATPDAAAPSHSSAPVTVRPATTKTPAPAKPATSAKAVQPQAAPSASAKAHPPPKPEDEDPE
jgi:uncharacterized protein (TIGR02266 family)